ncbi:MAG: extracellular solute-binding protein [Rhodospirillaceae bacterium]|nr:extracellular solute-binding protein [Rhodospirillaceae bacterium]
MGTRTYSFKSASGETAPTRRIGRRAVLKGAAAIAGAAIGSGAVRGFPTIWAQNIKDVTLNHIGMSYSTIIDIARKASEDLGFKIEMTVTDHPGFINRVTTQPDSVDIADGELWQAVLIVPRGVYQPVDPKRIKLWDKITPIYREGKFMGQEMSRQGNAPFEVQYLADAEGKSFASGPTEYATFMCGFYNADTLGMRPDLIKRPIESWAELFNPEFKGKAAIQDIPTNGIMDAAMALEARGDIKYGDKGEMTREEIDKTIDALIDLKKQGHWRALWSTFDESVNLMAAGEVVLQSMWSPAVTAVRSRGIPCYYVPLKEGYRGWGNGLALMRHLKGIKLDAAYEYLNWYNSGWVGGFIAKQGYYVGVPETAKEFLTENEWGYWYEGKAATEDIKDPYGTVMEKAGAKRDGGSYEERFSRIACWNSAMKEARYVNEKWNEFRTA